MLAPAYIGRKRGAKPNNRISVYENPSNLRKRGHLQQPPLGRVYSGRRKANNDRGFRVFVRTERMQDESRRDG
jgi:hypothetical protein